MTEQKPTIPSPLKPRVPVDGEKINLGRKLANSTRCWMEQNEPAFMEIYRFVKGLQGNCVSGRLHDRVATYCTDHHLRMSDTPGIKFSNDTWTGVARYLVIYDPTLLNAPVKLKPSAIDHVGLWRIGWMEKRWNRTK